MRNRGSSTYQVRLVYGSPADVNGSDGIGLASERARYATKAVPGGAVALVNTTAFGTGSGGISGVNEEHRNSSELRLVLDKRAELAKAPGVQRPSLRLPSRYPRSYPLEILKGDAALRVLSLTNNAFGDHVVDVLGHPPFLLLALLEKFVGCFRLTGLEPRPDSSIAMPQAFELRAGVDLTVGISGDVLYAEINPEPVFGRAGWRLLDIDRSHQIPLAIAAEEITLTLARLQHLSRSLVADKRDALTTGHRPDRHRLIKVPKDAVVVSDGAERLKDSFSLLVQLVGVRDFGDSAYHHLSGKVKANLDLVIRQFVQLVLPERFSLPRHLADGVRSFVGVPKRFFERLLLLSGRQKLYRDSQLHAQIVPQVFKNRKKVRRVLLRSPRIAVSCPASL